MVIDLRRELGDALLPTFDQRYDWLNEVMGGIGPEDWGKPCYHTNGIRPVEWFPGVVIQELAIHEWDIRSTVEQSPLVSEASLPCLNLVLLNGRPVRADRGQSLFRPVGPLPDPYVIALN